MKCLILFTVCLFGTTFGDKIINCYFGSWAGYRSGNGKFEPVNIDPKLCTHLSYTFFGINNDGSIKILDPWNDLDNGKGGISKTIALKKQNARLKVLAVVGGWNEYSAKYSSMAADPKKRALFISSSIKFIEEHGFDGLDLDWEYPAQRDGSPKDRVNFVTLLKELNAAFKKRKLILGIAVAAAEHSARISYDIPNISKYVDLINVMTYDFAGVWDGKLGFNAPLHGSGANNVESSIKYWLDQGAPAHKLIMGVGFYGRTFTTSTGVEPGSLITGSGARGKYTQEGGFLGYNEICEDINSWTVKWDDKSAVPYAYKGNQWVGYDNVKSIGIKMDFLKSMQLGGAMIWSIDTDDFKGTCGNRFPLLREINRALGHKINSGSGSDNESSNGSGVVPTTPTTTVVPPKITTKPTTPPSSGNNVDHDDCKTNGYFVNKTDCGKFYLCKDGLKHHFECPSDLYFDEKLETCNWRSSVHC